jgi:hypothetical protein
MREFASLASAIAKRLKVVMILEAAELLTAISKK